MQSKLFLPVTFALVAVFACLGTGYAADDSLVYDRDQNLLERVHVEASSAAGAPGQVYSAECLVDGDFGQAWASKAGAKLPQWVKAAFSAPRQIDTLVLVVRDLPTLYATWKTVNVEFSAGEPVTATLDDRPGAHMIRFDRRATEWVKVTLVEAWSEKTYYGLDELLAFDDTARAVIVNVPPPAPESPAEQWQNIDLTEKPRETHPCVYITPEDIAVAKENIANNDWARQWAEQTIALADGVVDKDPEWIREHCPPKGAAFAYGSTGCPICDSSWGTWGGANCSFDRPGTIMCGKGHVLPDKDHPDEGTGYVNADGRVHYFVGSYNAWVVETYEKWAGWLARAYVLTGEEKYAKTAAVLLDALAEIYPSCNKGSWDYAGGAPEGQTGRLDRPHYQVARVLVLLVYEYDAIFNSATLDEPSFVDGLTRRENIVENMLKNGGAYCYEHSLAGGMNNGEADYVRGVLAVGCLLGIDTYVDWATTGPYGIYAMVNNNADRDGRYIESSLGYSMHARDLYLTSAEPLCNLRNEKYPNGINLYDDAAFRSFYVLPHLAMDCVGHWPRYGDSGPDTSQAYPPAKQFDSYDYKYAERIYNRTTQPETISEFGELVSFFGQGNVDGLRGGSSDREWLVFHAKDAPACNGELTTDLQRILYGSTVLGQKGFALLRTQPGVMGQACLLRYGPVLNHGHQDDLNINYFGLGYELTYDTGYGNGATHSQKGFSHLTAAHQLVVVNERPQLEGNADDTGGNLNTFASMPGMQVIDADSNNAYKSQDVDEYRRFLALVGEGPGSYLLDIFTVKGGAQHDYMAHALSNDLTVDGVTLSEPADGSLAGEEYNWGERQLNDGFLSGVPHTPYWRAPPGNGYGFLMNPRRGMANGPFSATWKLPQGNNFLKMTMLPEEDTEVITTWAPGIYPFLPKSAHIALRHTGDTGYLNSTFVSIREPYGETPASAEGVQAAELMGLASTEDGVYKYLGTHGVLLFQADEVGGVINFALEAKKSGPTYLFAQPYVSPNYGTVQFMVDGKDVGEPYIATNPSVQNGKTQVVGPFDLKAGKHTVGVRIVSDEGARSWVSIRSLALMSEKPDAGSVDATPTIAKAMRLPVAGSGTCIAVQRTDGGVEWFAYSERPDGRVSAGAVRMHGTFGHVRGSRTSIDEMHIVGKALTAPGMRVELNNAQYSGRIVKVDYEKNLVYVDADLPTDGRLKYQSVMFSNPRYTRNSAYTIYDVRKEDGLSVIDMGTQRAVLGQGTVMADPDHEHRMYSLTAHDYARGLTRGGVNFFDGKLLVHENKTLETNVINAKYAQPFIVDVDSTDGFKAGDMFYYMDLQPGDDFVIRNWATVEARADGSLDVTATDDVKVWKDGKMQSFPWGK